ncbi:hypothetical protein [Caulobacter sp.]|uniref:hypothetical protein n=1 Tax=Caulobacter sp. TaxID=78 RepID=UPI003BAE8322
MTLGYSSFVTPTTNVVPAFSGGGYFGAFGNTATFTCAPSENCAAGAYRQYVKGAFSANGSPVTHVLCGSIVLSTITYLEDGCPPAGANCAGCTAYGYRACTMTNDGYTNPDQATGADFWMTDAPGFTHVTSGTAYVINLSFQGSLINTTTNGVLVSKNWTVNGAATAPAPAPAPTPVSNAALSARPAAVGLRQDKIFSVDLTRNLISGLPEVHVVIRRAASDAPLSPEAVEIALTDALGRAVPTLGQPIVHEVSSRAGLTATVVHTLPDLGDPPELASLTVPTDGRLRGEAQVTVLPVRLR